MIKTRWQLKIILIVIFILNFRAIAADITEGAGGIIPGELNDLQGNHESKLYLSLDSGYHILNNITPDVSGTKKMGGSVSATGGEYLNLEYFLNPKLSAITQAMIIMQFTYKNVLTRGYEFGFRYYYFGVGSEIVGKLDKINYRLNEKLKQFIEVYFGKRDYHISFNAVDYNPLEGATFYEGSYYHFLCGLGFAYTLSSGVDLTIRALYAPIGFAASGDGVVLQETSFLAGLRFNIF